MKLYYAPGACSIGIHVLLEELGKPYDAEAVNLREGAQYKPEFIEARAKSRIESSRLYIAMATPEPGA